MGSSMEWPEEFKFHFLGVCWSMIFFSFHRSSVCFEDGNPPSLVILGWWGSRIFDPSPMHYFCLPRTLPAASNPGRIFLRLGNCLEKRHRKERARTTMDVPRKSLLDWEISEEYWSRFPRYLHRAQIQNGSFPGFRIYRPFWFSAEDRSQGQTQFWAQLFALFVISYTIFLLTVEKSLL